MTLTFSQCCDYTCSVYIIATSITIPPLRMMTTHIFFLFQNEENQRESSQLQQLVQDLRQQVYIVMITIVDLVSSCHVNI